MANPSYNDGQNTQSVSRGRGIGRGRGRGRSSKGGVKKTTSKKREDKMSNEERRILVSALVVHAQHYAKGDNPTFYSKVFQTCKTNFPAWNRDRHWISGRVRYFKHIFNGI